MPRGNDTSLTTLPKLANLSKHEGEVLLHVSSQASFNLGEFFQTPERRAALQQLIEKDLIETSRIDPTISDKAHRLNHQLKLLTESITENGGETRSSKSGKTLAVFLAEKEAELYQLSREVAKSGSVPIDNRLTIAIKPSRTGLILARNLLNEKPVSDAIAAQKPTLLPNKPFEPILRIVAALSSIRGRFSGGGAGSKASPSHPIPAKSAA